jgi:hypothetical protein
MKELKIEIKGEKHAIEVTEYYIKGWMNSTPRTSRNPSESNEDIEISNYDGSWVIDHCENPEECNLDDAASLCTLSSHAISIAKELQRVGFKVMLMAAKISVGEK